RKIVMNDGEQLPRLPGRLAGEHRLRAARAPRLALLGPEIGAIAWDARDSEEREREDDAGGEELHPCAMRPLMPACKGPQYAKSWENRDAAWEQVARHLEAIARGIAKRHA